MAGLVPLVMFAVADFYLYREHLTFAYGIKSVAGAILLAGAATLRTPRSRSFLIILTLVFAVVLYALSTTLAIVSKEPLTTPLINICVALGTATLLPWGALPQLMLVMISVSASAATTYGVIGSLSPLTSYPNVGVGIGLLLSIYIARAFDRSHREILRYQVQQQHAESEVRQLNAVLEQRVVERTAALEHVNRELHHEIERRAETEARLHQSQAALAALIETTDAAIWSVDREFLLTAYNSRAREGFERRFGGPIHKVQQILPTDVQSKWHDLYGRAFAGERFSTELEMPIEGHVHYLLVALAPIIINDVVTGVSVSSTDITKRKHAEEAAHAHQAQLTHVLRLSTMGEMASGLAHEINQPLGAIANFATGCVRRLRNGGMHADDVLRIVEQIAGEALRAGTIIRRLRSLIRKDSSRQEQTDLNELVNDAVRLLASDLRNGDVTVALDLDEALPSIYVDSIQIEQVLLNLLRNAVDAMADAETDRRALHISTAIVDEATVELKVRDYGSGLPPTIGERIFEPFVSTKTNGLGLGLSISRTIIEAHGGRLWTTAHPDGTTFAFHLPMRWSAEHAAEARYLRSA